MLVLFLYVLCVCAFGFSSFFHYYLCVALFALFWLCLTLRSIKFGLLTLMIRTHYYLLGTYLYLDFVGGKMFFTSFDQFFDWLLSGVWWPCPFHEVVSGDLWYIMCIWSYMTAYMRAYFPDNPAGNDLYKFQDNKYYLPFTSEIIHLWFSNSRVPDTISSLGIQGRNHHECIVYELSGAQNY